MPSKETFEPRIENREHRGSAWMDAGQSVREEINYIAESAPQNGHDREMAFLRHLMLYDESGECRELEGRTAQAQNKERCIRRAAWLMAVLTALAVVGLGYSAILLEDFPQNKTHLLMRIFYSLGLASLVSLLAFGGYWLVCAGELNEQRERCRRLVTRIVESRLGKPVSASLPQAVRTRFPRSRVAAEDRKSGNGETA